MLEIFKFISKKEQVIEGLRARICRLEQFEPRQAFARVAMDPHRLEASDIFHYIGRFEAHETHTIDACHFLIRYWS